MNHAPTPAANIRRSARFNYLADSIPHSLYRNGNVSLTRRPDGTDAGMEGYIEDARQMQVADARLDPGGARGLNVNGFELFRNPLKHNDIDFLSHEDVVSRHYPECINTLKEITGARYAFAFDHNIRWAAAEEKKQQTGKGQQVQRPIRLVHGDYTLTSAPQRLRDLAAPPRINDTMRPFLAEGESVIPPELVDEALSDSGRFAIINLWRNIHKESPVLRDPVGYCDAQTIATEDLVVFELHYTDRIGENYFAHAAERHQWYFFSEMTHEEVVLIKQWDSAGAFAASKGSEQDADSEKPCSLNFHSAFEDPHTKEDAPDRRSIEVRCIAIY